VHFFDFSSLFSASILPPKRAKSPYIKGFRIVSNIDTCYGADEQDIEPLEVLKNLKTVHLKNFPLVSSSPHSLAGSTRVIPLTRTTPVSEETGVVPLVRMTGVEPAHSRTGT
jgi:hypothetical protein